MKSCKKFLFLAKVGLIAASLAMVIGCQNGTTSSDANGGGNNGGGTTTEFAAGAQVKLEKAEASWAFYTYDLSKYTGKVVDIDLSVEMAVDNSGSKADSILWQVNTDTYPVLAAESWPSGKTDWKKLSGSLKDVELNDNKVIYISTYGITAENYKIYLKNIDVKVTSKGDLAPIDDGCEVKKISYKTKAYYDAPDTEITKEAYIYLPKDYGKDPAKKYNVMYLLHGVGGTIDEWTMGSPRTRIRQHMLELSQEVENFESFIIVTPNGRSCKDFNNTAMSNMQGFYSFGQELRNDLIPFIDANYQTYAEGAGTAEYDITASRDHRAVAGLSMGGMQTTNIGLCECLDLFSYFGGFSSAPTTYEAKKIAEILNGDTFDAKYDIKFFYNICGTSDGTAGSSHGAAMGLEGGYPNGKPTICNLTDRLTDGVNFKWETMPGGHDHSVWFAGFKNFAKIAFTK